MTQQAHTLDPLPLAPGLQAGAMSILTLASMGVNGSGALDFSSPISTRTAALCTVQGSNSWRRMRMGRSKGNPPPPPPPAVQTHLPPTASLPLPLLPPSADGPDVSWITSMMTSPERLLGLPFLVSRPSPPACFLLLAAFSAFPGCQGQEKLAAGCSKT